MKQSWLFAVFAGPLVCALPLQAMAQSAAPAEPPCRVGDKAAERASAALPARAGTRPMPERGTVAPANRVPSHVESGSSRAMAAARRETEDAKKNPGADCEPVAQEAAPAGDGSKE
ncbi:MAG: hypothetical protein AB1807_04985 [Pseudomonadota bacterium]